MDCDGLTRVAPFILAVLSHRNPWIKRLRNCESWAHCLASGPFQRCRPNVGWSWWQSLHTRLRPNPAPETRSPKESGKDSGSSPRLRFFHGEALLPSGQPPTPPTRLGGGIIPRHYNIVCLHKMMLWSIIGGPREDLRTALLPHRF